MNCTQCAVISLASAESHNNCFSGIFSNSCWSVGQHMHTAVSSLKTGRCCLVRGQMSCWLLWLLPLPADRTIEAAQKALGNKRVFFRKLVLIMWSCGCIYVMKIHHKLKSRAAFLPLSRPQHTGHKVLKVTHKRV